MRPFLWGIAACFTELALEGQAQVSYASIFNGSLRMISLPQNLSSRLAFLLECVLVVVIASYFCLWDIGTPSFGEGDPTIHAKATQEMLQSGDWFTPTIDGKPYFSKPPFKMWLSLIPLMLFGESNFGYRVTDGVIGITIILTTFLFARRFFASRSIAALAVLALLGAKAFFFSHGVRDSVQDGMLILLTTWIVILGWKFCNLESFETKRLWNLALCGGSLLGFAFLTKHAGAAIAPFVVGVSALLSGTLPALLREKKRFLFASLALAVVIASLYIVPHALESRAILNVMFYHEIYKRAVVGYHFVGHRWFYLRRIILHRALVPPELLLGGIVLAVIALIQKHDRRFALLLAWGVAPVVAFSLMKSKLFWYIYPTLPALAILVAVFVHRLGQVAAERLRQWHWASLQGRLWTSVVSIAFCSSIVILSRQSVAVGMLVAAPKKTSYADRITGMLSEYERTHQQDLVALLYKPPRLNKSDRFYLDKLGIETVTSFAAIRRRIRQGDVAMIVTGANQFAAVAQKIPLTHYAFAPPHNERRTWLAYIGVRHMSTVRGLHPKLETIEFGTRKDPVLFGLKGPEVFHAVTVRAVHGTFAGFTLKGNLAWHALPSELLLRIASTIPETQGGLDFSLSVSGVDIEGLHLEKEGFQILHIPIPPGTWQSGVNPVVIRFHSPGAFPLSESSSPALVDWVAVDLSP